MSDISNKQPSHIGNNIIKVLHMRNVKMGKELGILRITAIGLALITITLLICTISTSIRVKSLESDLSNYKEAYDSATELNLYLQEEIDALKKAATNTTVPPEETTSPSESNPTSPSKPIEEQTKPTQEPTKPSTKVPEKFADVPLDDEVKAYIYTSAIKANIPPEVMFSLAWKESNFNPKAVSATNDHGLFQINKGNFRSLSEIFGYDYDEFCEKIYDPYVNADCSIYMLKSYYNNYSNGNWHHVLMRYNMGPGNASELFNKGVYSTYYSRTVLSHAKDNYGFTNIDL